MKWLTFHGRDSLQDFLMCQGLGRVLGITVGLLLAYLDAPLSVVNCAAFLLFMFMLMSMVRRNREMQESP